MLILSFLSCALLLVQSVICGGLQQDPPSANEKLSEQFGTDTNINTYGYHHPPLLEVTEQRGLRKEKSLNINEQTTTKRTHSRGNRRRVKSKASTPSLEIPVQVIYDTASTTVRTISKSTVSPLDRTTRVSVRRRKLQSNRNKKIDIRQTTSAKSIVATDNISGNVPTITENSKNDDSITEFSQNSRKSQSDINKKTGIKQTTTPTNNIATETFTGNVPTFAEKDKSDVSSTEFPQRSRGSYFKKRTEEPAPKVKILEEKNFVYAHSGNFHYSFLADDGTQVSSQGSLKSYDNNKTGEAVSGNVFYKDKDGNDYSLTYTADENGYRPIGAHLPTPPPVPPAIARALKYIADRSTTSSPLAKNE